jgi:putative transposase
LGCLWAVVVPAASIQNADCARLVVPKLGLICRRLKVIFADSAYGRFGLLEWAEQLFGWVLQTVLRPAKAKGFVILPKRWIVERTFSWLLMARRLSKDDERLPATTETSLHIPMLHLMYRRINRSWVV